MMTGQGQDLQMPNLKTRHKFSSQKNIQAYLSMWQSQMVLILLTVDLIWHQYQNPDPGAVSIRKKLKSYRPEVALNSLS